MPAGSNSMGAPTSGRARPLMTADTEFYWAGTQRGELLAQQCSACGTRRHPPGPACPNCHSFEWAAVELPLEGTLYSYTVQHHPLPAGFGSPCVVGLIELEEGIRVVSNIIGVEPEDLVIGETLAVVFLGQVEGWTAPQLRRPDPARPTLGEGAG